MTTESLTKSDTRVGLVSLAVVALGLAASAVSPHDTFTWFLEVAPIFIAVPIMLATRTRFPLTPLVMGLIAFHALVLCVGGHYTYARVPFGFWIGHVFGFSRNHYDRFGHFVQGFVPAIIARELLLRHTPLRRGGWLFFLVVCVCLAISATYEFIEWWTALAQGADATDFLGTQGDPWDTQTDMLSLIHI